MLTPRTWIVLAPLLKNDNVTSLSHITKLSIGAVAGMSGGAQISWVSAMSPHTLFLICSFSPEQKHSKDSGARGPEGGVLLPSLLAGSL